MCKSISNDKEIMVRINNSDNFFNYEKRYVLSDFQNINLSQLQELISPDLLVHDNSEKIVLTSVTYTESRVSNDLPRFLVVTNRTNKHLEALLDYVSNCFLKSRKSNLELIKILLELSNQPKLVMKYLKIFNQMGFTGLGSKEMGALLYSAGDELSMIKILYEAGIDCNSFNNVNQSVLHMITDSLKHTFCLIGHFSKEQILAHIKKRIQVTDSIIRYILSLPNNKLTMNDIGNNEMTPTILISKFYSRLEEEFNDININEYDSLMKYI